MAKIKIIRKNRKGIFFTFIALTMMAIFILIYSPQGDLSLQKDTQAARTRISAINNYVGSLETDYLQTVLRASAYKSLLSLSLYINSTGKFPKNLDSAFYEIITNGTIGNVPIDSITNKKIMENNTLTNWNSKIISAANDAYNVNTAIWIKNVSVYQTDPWSVNSVLIINFTVTSESAEWTDTNISILSQVDTEGLYDPYPMGNTNGKYSNRIKRSSVSFDKWNISKVREHLRNGTYVHWPKSEAPSLLMRFANDSTNSSCCGIESMVNPNLLNPSDQMQSYVDYLFFNNSFAGKCTLLFNITNPAASKPGLWDEFRYFKMDSDHKGRYNISDIDTITAC